MISIPFQTIPWQELEKQEQAGEKGTSISRNIEFRGLRIRMVDYSSGYLADHWCEKGHIVHCLEGEFNSELQGSETIRLTTGDTYVVSDGMSSHRSFSEHGAKLLIIDGDFLKSGS